MITSTEDSIQKVHEIIKNYKPLKAEKGRYFTRPKGTQDIPLDKITPSKAREGGIQHAYELMKKAFNRKARKRAPVSLADNGDGTYTILDGNSTFANVAASGWDTIPALIGAK